MRDDNLNLNNLNIPPSDNSSNVQFDWFNVLHLITPIALGYVYYKGKEEKAAVEEKLKMEIALREEKELKLKHREFDTEPWQKEIAKIRREEEERAQQTLDKLSSIENSIKQILDIRCSPIIPRSEREWTEKYLLDLSRTEQFESFGMKDGLTQIFLHDENHCGGGFNSNGQIYRVWMKLWREKVKHEKNSRIQKRTIELYSEKQ